MRSLSLLIAACVFLALPAARSADPASKADKKQDAAKKTDDPKKADTDKKTADSKKDEPAKEFDIPVPLGIPVKGIKIPHRDENGKLVMTIEAEVAKKLDDQLVEMENMKIESFDDDGKKINIELPHSIFNIETRILKGDSHTLIRREDFEITGDAVEFNAKTRYAILRGNIRMVIQSADIVK